MEDLGVDWTIILKLIFKTWDERRWKKRKDENNNWSYHLLNLLSRIVFGHMESRSTRSIFSFTSLSYVTLVYNSHYHVLSVFAGFVPPQMITVLFLTRL
jgi:hypothetical protein